MKTIGIYYGSSTGTTQEVAEAIARLLGVDKSNVYDVANADANFSAYEVLLFGSSTMGYGDLQDDWESFIDKVKSADLSGKIVALFGCGDSASYSDTFCDAMGLIYKAIEPKGCKIVGQVDASDYNYDDSTAVVSGKFVGLAIDNDNESDKTDERIMHWVEQLKPYFS